MKGFAVGAGSAAAPRRRRWPFVAAAAGLAVLLLLGNAAGPYLFRVATLQSEIATQVRATTGLDIVARGHARFDLLPSPRVKMSAVRISDPSGLLTLDAAALRGDVRLLPLLVGRVELAAATLIEPRLVIDVDGRAVAPDSLIGHALHPRVGAANGGDRRLGAVTLVDGTATLVSRRHKHLPVISAIDATIDWRDLDSPATLTGAMRIAGTAADVAAWVEQPSALMRGDRSAAAVRLHSTPLDLSANGNVTAAAAASFRGHLSATAPSLAAVMSLCGWSAALPAPFANLSLNGETTLHVDGAGAVTLDLPSLSLAADGNTYEGTLAYQGSGAPILSGTLATERLALGPFLRRLPPLTGADHGWSTAGLVTAAGPAPFGLDLRISATHLRLPPVTIDDAALSVMTRGDRIEVALNEGKLYGAAAKGRVSIGATPAGLSLHGAGSVDGADAAAISWDLAGRQVLAGSVSGTGSFDTEGRDVAALMAHLKGWARGGAAGGDISGTDLGLGLRALARGRRDEITAALRSGRTPFRKLSFDLRIDGGIATLGEASLAGRDADLSAGGTVDLGAKRYDLHAVATAPDAGQAAGSPAAAPAATLPLRIGGSLDRPVIQADGAPANR